MAKAIRNRVENEVIEYYQKLTHPLKEVVESLRKIILTAHPDIGEQIKWNSPAFYFTGEMRPFDPKEYKRDLVVLNLGKKDHVLLVFPTGAKIKDKTGFLEGNYADARKMARISSVAEAKEREKDLSWIVKEWVRMIDT